MTEIPMPPLPGSELVGRSFGSVKMRAIEWLWTGWIPRGYITLFAGETGAGKGTVLADIAARVTTGAPWPGEQLEARRTPARVLWLGSEDSPEEMTVPRLTVGRANLDLVVEIQGSVQGGKRRTFSMQDDIEKVSQWLDYATNTDAPFAMLVVDPVTSYLSGKKLKKVDLSDAGQLRTILEPWLLLAQKHCIAIVCVTHFAKDTNRAMLHRVLGSQAFAATCRSLCAIIENPSAAGEEADPHAKLMMQVKSNLPEHPGGAWKFSTEKAQAGWDERNGKPIHATRPVWDELDSALTPKTIVGTSGPKSQMAFPFIAWLGKQFADVPEDHFILVEKLMSDAVSEGVVSTKWWKEHSKEYLYKKNIGGVWKCRPMFGPKLTGGPGNTMASGVGGASGVTGA